MRNLRARAAVLVLAALVTVLLGAEAEQPDPARARLRAMSAEQLQSVEAALREFELRIAPAEQEALRAIDRKLTDLAPEDRIHYLAVLRRYHNWLSSLPEGVRDGLLAKPPDLRMAEIRTLLKRYPIPSQQTPFWIRFSDVGGPSAFELAALFKTWRQLTPAQRKQVEELPVPRRLARLHALGREMNIDRELRPDDFDLPEWLSRAEARLSELRLAGPELKPAASEGSARKGLLKEQARPLVLHRFAVNLYTIERAPKEVRPDALARFAGDLPSWIRAALRSDGDDWARRKLELAYRLVFPHPAEYQPTPSSATATGKPSAPASPKVKAAPVRPPGPVSPSSTPF